MTQLCKRVSQMEISIPHEISRCSLNMPLPLNIIYHMSYDAIDLLYSRYEQQRLSTCHWAVILALFRQHVQ